MPEATIIKLPNSPMVLEALKGCQPGEKVTISGTITPAETGAELAIDSISKSVVAKAAAAKSKNPLDYILRTKKKR